MISTIPHGILKVIMIMKPLPGLLKMAMAVFQEIPETIMMAFREVSETIMTAPQKNPAIRTVRLMTLTPRARMDPVFLPASP